MIASSTIALDPPIGRSQRLRVTVQGVEIVHPRLDFSQAKSRVDVRGSEDRVRLVWRKVANRSERMSACPEIRNHERSFQLRVKVL
jgi:hypothetical protein